MYMLGIWIGRISQIIMAAAKAACGDGSGRWILCLAIGGLFTVCLEPILPRWPSFHVEDNLSCHCRKAVDRIWDS